MHKYKTHIKPKNNPRANRKPVDKTISAIINEVFKENSGKILIAIGGPGGTGKSEFAKRLAGVLGDCAVLLLDDYKTSRKTRNNTKIFGPNPDANKMDLIVEHLKQIKAGLSFNKPVYDSKAGDSLTSEVFQPKRFNIIDGEISTYREFRDLTDFSVFIDSDWHTQLNTRINRDINMREYTPEKAMDTFLNSNLREFSVHGAESRKWADIHLFCHNDYRLEVESVSVELHHRVWNIINDEHEGLEISGLLVPLLTPFTPTGTIDRKAFVGHLSMLSEAGVRRVIVGGTTGEFFSLTSKERIEVLKLTLEYFPWLVIFNVSAQSLQDTIDLAKKAESLGVDAILCLPPYYYAGAPSSGVIAYYDALVEEVQVPLILYNFPRHTQIPLTPEIISAVSHFGMKDSEGKLSLINSTPRYFAGRTEKIFEACHLGAIGFVSAMANVVPEIFVEMEESVSSGCWDSSKCIQEKINNLKKTTCGNSEIPLLKHLLSERIEGYPNAVRIPLTQLTSDKAKSAVLAFNNSLLVEQTCTNL